MQTVTQKIQRTIRLYRYRAYQLEHIAKCTTIKHNVNNSKRLLRSNFPRNAGDVSFRPIDCETFTHVEYREMEQEKLR